MKQTGRRPRAPLSAQALIALGFLLIIAGANSRQGGAMVITGIVVAALGSLVSWFVSLLARGFGEMVNNVRIQTELAVRHHSGKE